MENSTFTFLSTLQNTLTYNNVEALKQSFIKEMFDKHEEAPRDLNEEFGIFEYYDNFKGKFMDHAQKLGIRQKD
jgi:phosphoglycerol transferase MdoB-like AlkP superfamily enzyme